MSTVKNDTIFSPCEKLLFSKREAAHMLSVSPRTLDTLIANRRLPVRRVHKRVLIHRTDLHGFARKDHYDL